MIYNIMDEQQEQQERAKLLDFGLTSDVVDIVIAKKKELERKRSCVIIPIPEPIPIPTQEPIDIIPAPEPEIPVVDDGRRPSSGAEIKEQEEHIVEIKQEQKIYSGMPIWKRRLIQRNNK